MPAVPVENILQVAERSRTAIEYFREVLPHVTEYFGADYAAVLGGGTAWTVTADQGTRKTWPSDIVADCLDHESAVTADAWLAIPIVPRETAQEVLLIHRAGAIAMNAPTAKTSVDGEKFLAIFRSGLKLVRRIEHAQKRAKRTETILAIVQQWGRTHEMNQLLSQMAEASTQLLGADRASIFLWDRPNHLLVGRPALGVPEGELRVPDDAGVVGEVLRTGEPRRVMLRENRDPINRQIDATLGYQTRTLLAVPIRTDSGELLGVFETINKRQGEFTAEDESALTELASHAAVALENTQDRQRLLDTQRQLVHQAAQRVQLIGESPVIESLRQTVKRVAGTELAVLVLGENGTGKEIISQSIHYQSRRADRPFVAVNCAAMAETLLESELFGHERGAFTDAYEARQGKFEVAAGGTLFLDEIGDLSLGGQAKLLRVLEEKVVIRVGGSRPILVDVRVIAATNQNLADLVRNKKFREDLYFRLNVVVLESPPLRDRGDDILLLADHFLADFSRQAGRPVPKLSVDARKRLMQHHWPGNVRELRNMMERIAYLTTAEKIEAPDVAFILSPGVEDAGVLVVDQPLSEATTRFQIEYIHRAMQRTRGNLTDAADLLGLHRSNLYRKMKQLGMED